MRHFESRLSEAASGSVSPVAGIVLASGLSRRFGPGNKLLAPVHGEPIVRRTVRAYAEAELDPLLVVVGYQAEAVAAALRDLPVQIVRNPEFALGQSRALICGVAALPPDLPAAVIGVADQPLLSAAHIRTIVERYRAGAALVVAPRYRGRRGNPVLFDRSLFPELLGVEGDQGGRGVIERHASDLMWVDFPEGDPGIDIDSPADYEAVSG